MAASGLVAGAASTLVSSPSRVKASIPAQNVAYPHWGTTDTNTPFQEPTITSQWLFPPPTPYPSLLQFTAAGQVHAEMTRATQLTSDLHYERCADGALLMQINYLEDWIGKAEEYGLLQSSDGSDEEVYPGPRPTVEDYDDWATANFAADFELMAAATWIVSLDVPMLHELPSQPVPVVDPNPTPAKVSPVREPALQHFGFELPRPIPADLFIRESVSPTPTQPAPLLLPTVISIEPAATPAYSPMSSLSSLSPGSVDAVATTTTTPAQDVTNIQPRNRTSSRLAQKNIGKAEKARASTTTTRRESNKRKKTSAGAKVQGRASLRSATFEAASKSTLSNSDIGPKVVLEI
ncbi:hypothetical protein HMN09_00459700 [Mycena chlorophos]|uniref:Uncharacterized protein n=1 Tax=Mycena chlorophos TaxID=658473 RepID=A0A8H6TID7_MYCCL|nr:hypothetical protein HMN09_00459700 [Mycena chlorophos]